MQDGRSESVVGSEQLDVAELADLRRARRNVITILSALGVFIIGVLVTFILDFATVVGPRISERIFFVLSGVASLLVMCAAYKRRSWNLFGSDKYSIMLEGRVLVSLRSLRAAVGSRRIDWLSIVEFERLVGWTAIAIGAICVGGRIAAGGRSQGKDLRVYFLLSLGALALRAGGDLLMSAAVDEERDRIRSSTRGNQEPSAQRKPDP
jgi:hypothetical protein